MTIKEKLQEEFSFLKRQPHEDKDEYKRRLRKRSQELLDGKNCTLEESIWFKSLYNCGVSLKRSKHNNLINGNAKDIEKYIDLIFFEHLDEKMFQREKARLYDEYIKYIEKCNKRCSTYPHYCDYEYHQLLYDEYLEKIYEPKVKGKALSKTKKKHSIKYKLK